jgi:hypothetical protein
MQTPACDPTEKNKKLINYDLSPFSFETSCLTFPVGGCQRWNVQTLKFKCSFFSKIQLSKRLPQFPAILNYKIKANSLISKLYIEKK